MRLFSNPRRAHLDVDLLSAYLDNQVSAAERARVDIHLGSCAVCRAELDSLQQTLSLLHALPRVRVPRAFTLSESRLGIRRPAQRPAWPGGVLTGLAAIVTVALVIILGSVLVRQSGTRPVGQVALAPAPTAPSGARIMVAPAAAPKPQEASGVSPVPASPTPAVKETVVVEKSVEKAIEAPAAPMAEPTRSAPLPPSPSVPVPPSVTPQPAAKALAPAAAAPTPTTAPRPAEATAPAKLAAASPSPEPPAEMQAAALGRGGGADQTSAAAMPEALPPAAPLTLTLPGKAGVAYADAKGLWTLDREAGARQVVQGEGITGPVISPDRAWIAYRVLRGDHFELWAVRWDGKDPHPLLTERNLPKDDLPQGYSERRFRDVRWIPGSTTLALNVTVVPTSGDVLPRFEIWTVAVQTGVSQLAIRMEAFGQPFFSPDGRRLALLQPGSDQHSEGSLSLYNADGTGGRVVLKFARDANPRNHESQVSWLPDSQSLWVAIPDLADSPDKLNGLTLYRIGADGQANMAGRIPAFDTFWSPDGTRLAYTQAVSGSLEIRELWLAKADGTDAQRYTQLRDGQFINWSPDGTYFLYADSGQVYLGQIGQTPQHVGNFVSVFDPHWIAPNQFLYLHDQGTGWMLASRTVNGPTASLRLLPREVTYDVTRP